MSLFSTVAEIKNYLSVAITFKFPDIASYIKQAESKYIIPALSQVEYDRLHAAYQGSIAASPVALTDDDAALLDKVRLPLANFAYMLWIPIGQVQINSGGIQVVSNENLKPAFENQIRKLENSFNNAGYQGIDDLYYFLEVNKATFTDWAGSTSFTEFKSYFIKSSIEFSETGVNISNSRRTFLAMKTTMKKIEDFYIKSITGVDLFDEIKSQLLGDSVTANNTKLLNLIRPAVANMTIARAISELAVVITDTGIQVYSNPSFKTIDALSSADENQKAQLRNQSKEDGENYLKQLRDYLYTNVADYPLFESSSAYTSGSSDIFTNDENSKIYFL